MPVCLSLRSKPSTINYRASRVSRFGQPPALGRALKRRLAAAAAASPLAATVHLILSISTSIAVRLEPVHRPIRGKEARERGLLADQADVVLRRREDL